MIAISAGAARDIEKLNAGKSRVRVALDALKEEKLSTNQIGTLVKLARSYQRKAAKKTTTSVAINLAEKILETLNVGKDGFIKLTIPEKVSDIDAMKALNEYFRNKFPKKNRPAICERDFNWYSRQPSVVHRDITKERKIEVNVLLESTFGIKLRKQIALIEAKNLVLATPEEVALIAAAYACKNHAKDLFEGNLTRSTAHGTALATDTMKDGLYVFRAYKIGADACAGAAASRRSR